MLMASPFPAIDYVNHNMSLTLSIKNRCLPHILCIIGKEYGDRFRWYVIDNGTLQRV